MLTKFRNINASSVRTLSINSTTSVSNSNKMNNIYVTGISSLIGDIFLGDSPSDNIKINGTVTFSQNDINPVTFNSNVLINGTLGVNGNTSIVGTLGVTGNTTLSNTTVDGTLGVTSNSTLSNTTVDGTFNVVDNTTLESDLNILGGLSVSGLFDVDQSSSQTTLNSTFVVSAPNISYLFGNVILGTNSSNLINVQGVTSLDSTLNVAGVTNLASTLSVIGATNLASTLGVSGITALGSDLGVSGTTTLNGLINGSGLNRGSVSCSGTTTIVTVTGMTGSSVVVVSPTSDINGVGASRYWVTSASNQFTINLDANSGSVTFNWFVIN